MDGLQSIIFGLKQERFAHLQQVKAINRALTSLRWLRAPMHAAKVTASSVAANRVRGRKAWRTRVKNQKKKLALVRSKAA